MSGAQIAGWLIFFGALAYAALQSQQSTATDGGSDVSNIALTNTGGPDGSDIDTLARTLYGEARGESDEGKQGVGSVIMNRFNQGWGGRTSVAAVCRQPYQFSCWNANDPNLATITNVTADDPMFAHCLDLAAQIISGELPDNTDGAVFYYGPPLTSPPAVWGNVIETVKIDHQTFFRQAGIV